MQETKYLLTSDSLSEAMLFTYANGCLKSVYFGTGLSDRQLDYLAESMPMRENQIEVLASNAGKLKVVELDLSFENFWNTYAHKMGSKAKTEKAWNLLKDSEKAEAFNAIPKQNYFCKATGQAKPFPSTFINQRRWENAFTV